MLEFPNLLVVVFSVKTTSLYKPKRLTFDILTCTPSGPIFFVFLHWYPRTHSARGTISYNKKWIYRVTSATFKRVLDLAVPLKSLSGGPLFPCLHPKLASDLFYADVLVQLVKALLFLGVRGYPLCGVGFTLNWITTNTSLRPSSGRYL